MILCRPVTRGSVLAQKLVACVVYTAALMLFVGTTALLLGIAVHGTDRLVILIVRESILGSMDFWTGLGRYALAMPLLVAGALTVPLLAFALASFRMKPGTAAALTLAVLLADWTMRIHPAFTALNPYCLTTRIGTWRQVFSNEIPWPRIDRNLRQLAAIDVGLIVVAWAAFRRRPLTR
jgi:ABC-2 type transport system permease protein